MAEMPTPRTDAMIQGFATVEEIITHARKLETDLHHLARVAEGAAKPITMQDVRLCAGEGKLKSDHVLQAVNIILKRRLSEITRIKNQTT